jgi:hypothetical protein
MKSLFISHWAGESSTAGVFKEWIENVFEETHVFVSSSEEDIVLGERWEETMFAALRQAQLTIVMVSRRSYQRKWIHIEMGFSLARNLKVLIVGLDEKVSCIFGRFACPGAAFGYLL